RGRVCTGADDILLVCGHGEMIDDLPSILGLGEALPSGTRQMPAANEDAEPSGGKVGPWVSGQVVERRRRCDHFRVSIGFTVGNRRLPNILLKSLRKRKLWHTAR